ncbi:MAG TPA: O-antigen ligase family protein [Candidatus Omnitrophota bacterium]|nr:O-antigen ligase family protein [Candidatus Omnitrophota bacterium]HQL42073.1 O-antigen ligase family protein [Candidatus Omnitrophota bacterium]
MNNNDLGYQRSAMTRIREFLRMDRFRAANIAGKLVEYGFYGLIFFLPISKALIETCAGFILLGFLIRKSISKDLSSFKSDAGIFWLLLIFFVFNAMSLANSGPLLGKGIKTLFCKWLEYFLLFAIAIDHFKRARSIKRFIYVFVFGAALVGLSALSQKFFGFEFFRQRPIAGGIVTGPFENPNSFSPYLVICLCVVIALASWKWPRKALNFSLLGVGLILLVGLLFTFSRAGWLGFVAGSVVMMFLFDKKKLLLSLFAVFVLSLLLFFPFTQRLVYSFRAGWDSERFIIWRESITMIQENPFLGKGLGTYMDHSKKDIASDVGSHYAHNCYLQMWAETGMFTLLTFLLLAGFVLYRGIRISLRSKDDDLGILLGGLTAGLFGFLVASFFDTQLYSLQLSVLFWVMLGVAVALERILLHKQLQE